MYGILTKDPINMMADDPRPKYYLLILEDEAEAQLTYDNFARGSNPKHVQGNESTDVRWLELTQVTIRKGR